MGEGGRIGCLEAFLLALERFASEATLRVDFLGVALALFAPDFRVLRFWVLEVLDREVVPFLDADFRVTFFADLVRLETPFFLPLGAFFEDFFREAAFALRTGFLDDFFDEGFRFVDRFAAFFVDRLVPFLADLAPFRVAFFAALRVAFRLAAIATLPREGQGGDSVDEASEAEAPAAIVLPRASPALHSGLAWWGRQKPAPRASNPYIPEDLRGAAKRNGDTLD